MMRCGGKDRDGDPCRNKATNEENMYCRYHQYMVDYTPEMLANLTKCSGCLKFYCLPEGKKNCPKCNERSSKNGKVEREQTIKCVKEGCTYKRMSDEHQYCGKHQADEFAVNTAAQGMKVCTNVIRGCREQLSMDYKYTRCQICLQKDREKDHARRDKVASQDTTTPVSGEKPCTVCCKLFPLEHFQGVHGVTKTCDACRVANKRADEKRDKEHVNELSRENAQKPERKEVKKQWREDNYDKTTKYWLEYRARKVNEDLDGFLQRNAEQSRKWRAANPEKVQHAYKTRMESVPAAYTTYQLSAVKRGVLFELTEDQFSNMVKMPCHYCGVVQDDRGFNGIDRMNSHQHYTMSNSVSCCQMCNYMKKQMTPEEFISIAEHILTHLKLVPHGNVHPELFSNYHGVSFDQYFQRAMAKGLAFDMDKELFRQITSDPCYLCGKVNIDGVHRNGVDRLDNTLGYVMGNIKPCCGTCNYLKRAYAYDDVVAKLVRVYTENSVVNHVQEVGKDDLPPRRKPTKDDLETIMHTRREAKRAKFQSFFRDHEAREQHVQELVAMRQASSSSS